MNFLFLMDPLETVRYEKDTSLAFMLGARRRGHTVYYLPQGGITLDHEKVHFQVTQVTPQENPKQPFIVGEKVILSEEQVDAVFIRTDPPFNEAYLLDTWLLSRLPKSIPVINRPEGIRTANEKIWTTQFEDLIPKTLVTSSLKEMQAFLEQEKEIIAKPTDGHGGASVFYLRAGDKNASVTFETLSQKGKKYLILQEYIQEAENGDKRILLLNGEPLGAVLRVQTGDDHRNNFFAGGKPESAEITERDLEIIARLKPELQALGLSFVGIDILGDYLIEVNVTSPTCLQEMNRLLGKNLEEEVISFVEDLVTQTRGQAPLAKGV